MQVIATRICRKCKEEKSIALNFGPCKTTKICRDCKRAARQQLWHAKIGDKRNSWQHRNIKLHKDIKDKRDEILDA